MGKNKEDKQSLKRTEEMQKALDEYIMGCFKELSKENALGIIGNDKFYNSCNKKIETLKNLQELIHKNFDRLEKKPSFWKKFKEVFRIVFIYCASSAWNELIVPLLK